VPYYSVNLLNIYGNVAADRVKRKRLRNRWYKTVTLINNPSLVFERLVKRYQQEIDAAGSDDDERFRMKVITLVCGDWLFAPPPAYCTIFIIMPNEVVDLHICICIRTVTVCTCVRIGCAPQLRCLSLSSSRRPSFQVFVDLVSPVCCCVTRSHVTAAVFKLGRDFLTLFKSDVVE